MGVDLQMRRLFAIVVGLVTTILLISVYWGVYRSWQISPERIRLVRQKAFLKTIAYSVVDVYERTGILLTSEKAFVSTAIYPFQQNISELLGTPLSFEAAADRLVIKTALEGDYSAVVPLLRYTPKEVTLRRMRFLLEGRSRIYAFVVSQRELIATYAPPLPSSVAVERELSVPKLSSNLPRTNEELKQYLLWIESLLGSEMLRDGFGKELRISLARSTMRIRSPGADGAYNTPDDIVMVTTLGGD